MPNIALFHFQLQRGERGISGRCWMKSSCCVSEILHPLTTEWIANVYGWGIWVAGGLTSIRREQDATANRSSRNRNSFAPFQPNGSERCLLPSSVGAWTFVFNCITAFKILCKRLKLFSDGVCVSKRIVCSFIQFQRSWRYLLEFRIWTLSAKLSTV
jgi:hypothetical protein